MNTKLPTLTPVSRRQTALALLRLREASGVSQRRAGEQVGVSRRAIIDIEAAQCRATALQLFLPLLVLVIETKGVEAALDAIYGAVRFDERSVRALRLVTTEAARAARPCGAGTEPQCVGGEPAACISESAPIKRAA